MSVQIDKKVPIPPRHNATGLAQVMRQLKVGDSFLLGDMASGMANVYTRAKKEGIRISVRKTPEGVRVWRVE